MIYPKKYVGKEYYLKNNIVAKIIEYRGSKDVDIELSNGCVILKVTVDNLIKKQVANPLEKNVFGSGLVSR